VEIIPVDFKTIAAGETIFLGEYTLSEGSEILYSISVKTGNQIKVFSLRTGRKMWPIGLWITCGSWANRWNVLRILPLGLQQRSPEPINYTSRPRTALWEM
jgi:hypothetical protein